MDPLENLDYPIKVISFNDFKTYSEIPRYNKSNTSLKDIRDIDPSTAFFIFFSHCWIAGHVGSPEWRGFPHPDNLSNGKMRLCISSVERVWRTMASEMPNCYIWMDYTCIDQDADPAGELKQLDKIVQCMDCMITPLVNEDHTSWLFTDADALFYGYKAKEWCEGDYAYINRSWCRMEMLYAAHIPFRPNNNVRARKFEFALKVGALAGHRPHILYGTQELLRDRPLILERLDNGFLTEYCPSKGSITKESDRLKIADFMKQLETYMKPPIQSKYIGELNAKNQRHGQGEYICENGSRYIGSWYEDMRHGFGTLYGANGDTHEGNFQNNMRNGVCKGIYSNGDIYDGEWLNDRRHGYGQLSRTSISVYTGLWINGNRHGFGTLISWDGTTIQRGEWVDNKFCN